MRLLNLLLCISINVFCLSIAIAANQDPDFEKEKNLEISRGKERIQIGEDRINCLQNSKDFEGLKSCNQNMDKKVDALEARIKSQSHDRKNVPENKQHEIKHNSDQNKH